MNSKTEVANLSQSILGNASTVNNIDAPTTPAEKAYAKWYDTCRQYTLKMLMPNFALGRAILAKASTDPVFGYAYQYQKPTDCLKVLGIGDAQMKENDYTVEGNVIMTDNDYSADGMFLRYVKDITDVSKFSPEYIKLFAYYLALSVCIEVTKDHDKLTYLENKIPRELSSSSSINAQENIPVRVNHSKFKAARTQIRPVNFNKK